MQKKIAVVFPGQGSQSIGMLKELEDRPLVKVIFDSASSVLNYDLWHLIQKGPENRLNQTEYAQPALLTAEYAIWCIWREKYGITPDFLAGHSLGEYSALVCAEALVFEDALRLVRDRGRFMQEAIPGGRGGMVAIVGLSDDVVHGICKKASENEVLEIANYNSIGQVVVAGERGAIERMAKIAGEMGAKLVKILQISVPSHCRLMLKAADRLAERLQKAMIVKPEISIVHNVDLSVTEDPDVIRDLLVRQLYSPVHWVDTILLLQKEGVNSIFECGPGKVLTGLNKRIVPRGIELNSLLSVV